MSGREPDANAKTMRNLMDSLGSEIRWFGDSIASLVLCSLFRESLPTAYGETEIKITQEELVCRFGISRKHLQQVMSHLESRGYIQRPRRAYIVFPAHTNRIMQSLQRKG